MSLKTIAGPAIAAIVIWMSSQASAAVLFTNPYYLPPIGDYTGGGINHGLAVTNAFILPDAATATDVSVWTAMFPGDTPFAVDWRITTEAFGGETQASGHVDHISSTFVENPRGLDVRQATFSLGSVSLSGNKTYWLELHDLVTANQDWGYWAAGFGPSPAYLSDNGTVQRALGAHAFALNGQFVPEPGTVFLVFSSLVLATWGTGRRGRIHAMAGRRPARAWCLCVGRGCHSEESL